MTKSRGNFLVGSAGVAAAASTPLVAMAATAGPASASTSAKPIEKRHSTITTEDGTVIYYDDWGSGPPVFFSHGWPLSVDAWADHMFFLASNGFRCIGHDRRCHGRASQPLNGQDMDTSAAHLHELVTNLHLGPALH